MVFVFFVKHMVYVALPILLILNGKYEFKIEFGALAPSVLSLSEGKNIGYTKRVWA